MSTLQILGVKRQELERKKAQNSRLEGDVKDARERERLATEVSSLRARIHEAVIVTYSALHRRTQIIFLERMIPFAEYNSSRAIFEQCKGERKAAHAEYKRAQATIEPFRELVA